jgi:hypothetical protein
VHLVITEILPWVWSHVQETWNFLFSFL